MVSFFYIQRKQTSRWLAKRKLYRPTSVFKNKRKLKSAILSRNWWNLILLSFLLSSIEKVKILITYYYLSSLNHLSLLCILMYFCLEFGVILLKVAYIHLSYLFVARFWFFPSVVGSFYFSVNCLTGYILGDFRLFHWNLVALSKLFSVCGFWRLFCLIYF